MRWVGRGGDVMGVRGWCLCVGAARIGTASAEASDL